MANAFEFTLNGRTVCVENCSPNTTLLEWLRGRGLTGAKEGCAEGDCGACSVALLDRDTEGRPAWRAINSCLVPVAFMAGRQVISVEGVACGKLHPVQQAMVDYHGSQCGYCTPGIIMSLFEGHSRDDLKQPWQLDDQLCGNLCRCTGYRPIVDSALAALQQKQAPATDGVNPVPPPADLFLEYENDAEQFFRPDSMSDLFKLLRRFPDARLVAGATELGLDITKRFKKFPVLIALEGVPELTAIHSMKDAWYIGAAATLTAIEDTLGEEYPALKTMLRLFGSRQIRNRATLGGNLVTASPIADSAPVLLAFDARLTLAGRGRDDMPLESFFTSYRKTALRDREIVVEVVLPRVRVARGERRFSAFYKVSKRREMDIATVSACFVLDLDKSNEVRHVRLAFGGVAPTPMRARRTERALMAHKVNDKTRERALEILAAEFTPISDVRGSAEYRRGLMGSLLEKFFVEEILSAPPERRARSATLVPLIPTISTGETEVSAARADPQAPILSLPQQESQPDEVTSASRLPGPCLPVTAAPHESAAKHVTGEALFVDDEAARQTVLEVWPVCSPHAHARLLRRDADAARAMPGIHAVLLAEDIPGRNEIGVVKHDEVLLADKEVFFHGQIVALVVGVSQEACRLAAEKVVVEYEPLPAVFTIEQALEAHSVHNEPNFIRRGDATQAFRNSPHRLEGEFSFGGQEHFYLETQAAWARPDESGTMVVSSSTQHPSEVQSAIAHVLGTPASNVIVQVPRVGGGFGGKETQAATPAALAALASWKTGRAVRVRYNRDQDMMLTGKRHPFLAKFQIGFDSLGLLLVARIELYSNGGWSLDLSQAVTDRALFHLDNAYFVPYAEFRGQVVKTNLPSNTAFRGFGGPQGMLVIEEILDRIARRLGLAPELVRERNLYRGCGETNTTPYGQEIEGNRLQTIWHELKSTSRFEERRREIEAWNGLHPHRKRGLAITPVKFGISFTVTHLNQAGALVLIYQDGSVQVNHGGTEMGQGIHTNILAIAAKELGIRPEKIRVMATSTDKVPNTSATAASAGTDLNGAAVKSACDTLLGRLRPVAAGLLTPRLGFEPDSSELTFADGCVCANRRDEVSVSFTEVVQRAYLNRVSLSATGYYRTPGISWDRATGRGQPFHYFANGAAVTEVEVDGFTGMMQVLRTDILQDAGDSINTGVNRGQIEGGFVQGMGWLTCEELKWDEQGRLLTHSPDTYKIPSVGDRPREFNVSFLARATQPDVIRGSKAVGEPPLMLAISVREAIRDAVAAFGTPGGEVALPSPATSEAIFLAIQERNRRPKLPALPPPRQKRRRRVRTPLRTTWGGPSAFPIGNA
jgi:xanthine dehydrogenase molybdopterin binding subunit/xanthine dehydrogenase small subunit